MIRNPNATASGATGNLMYALVGARSQILAAYSTTDWHQVKVLYRWPAAAQLGPLVADPAGGYALLPIEPAAGRRRLSPFVKGHACTAVNVHNKVMCVQSTPAQTHFVSVNLTTGTVSALPLSETGPVGWGMVAW